MYAHPILEQFAQECQREGCRIPPHLELMHLKTADSERCLRAARNVATSVQFDESQASTVLQASESYREHLLAAMLLLFRPATKEARQIFLERLLDPGLSSPQIVCVGNMKGYFASEEDWRVRLEERLMGAHDKNDRGQLSRALGALDACLTGGVSKLPPADAWERSCYELGAETYLAWCSRLRAALERLDRPDSGA